MLCRIRCKTCGRISSYDLNFKTEKLADRADGSSCQGLNLTFIGKNRHGLNKSVEYLQRYAFCRETPHIGVRARRPYWASYKSFLLQLIMSASITDSCSQRWSFKPSQQLVPWAGSCCRNRAAWQRFRWTAPPTPSPTHFTDTDSFAGANVASQNKSKLSLAVTENNLLCRLTQMSLKKKKGNASFHLLDLSHWFAELFILCLSDSLSLASPLLISVFTP
jgi:hypothetical protein